MSEWPLGAVELKVLDLEREVAFYERFGLTRVEEADGSATLGAGAAPLLRLKELHGGRERPRRTAGLYHFAILLPSEEELGGFLRRTLEQRLPMTGTADHFVSQALYFDDPEGNGIEVYADRAPELWQWDAGTVTMATDQLDIDGVLAVLPALKNPTIAALSDPDWVAMNTIIEESAAWEVIPRLKAAKAQGIVEYPLNKVVA